MIPVKNGVNGTQGTILFSEERGELKITQSKIAFTVDRILCVNNIPGTMPFSQERVSPKIDRSKIALTVNGVQSSFP